MSESEVAMLKTSIENIRLLSAVAALLGVWAILSPFLWSVSTAYQVSAAIVGVVIVLTAGYTAYMAHEEGRVNRYVAYIAGLGGLYIIISPYAFAVSEPNLLLNTFVTGALIGILSGYSGYVGPAVSASQTGGQPA